MGFLAVSVLSGCKFFPNLIKRQGIKMALKFLLRVSEKVLQNAVDWCLFELHRMLHCRDNCRSIEQEIHPLMRAFNRGGRLFEYTPVLT